MSKFPLDFVLTIWLEAEILGDIIKEMEKEKKDLMEGFNYLYEHLNSTDRENVSKAINWIGD